MHVWRGPHGLFQHVEGGVEDELVQVCVALFGGGGLKEGWGGWGLGEGGVVRRRAGWREERWV